MITIIVLLILAGITLNLVIGDNGIINRSKEAGEEYTKASIQEELQLKVTEIQMSKLEKGEQIERQDLIGLQEIGAVMGSLETPALGEYKDYDFIVDENYKVIMGGKLTGEKPELSCEVITQGRKEEGEEVEIKVTAKVEEGVVTIKVPSKFTLKSTLTDTDTEKIVIYTVKENGSYLISAEKKNERVARQTVKVTNFREEIVGYWPLTQSLENKRGSEELVLNGSTNLQFDATNGVELSGEDVYLQTKNVDILGKSFSILLKVKPTQLKGQYPYIIGNINSRGCWGIAIGSIDLGVYVSEFGSEYSDARYIVDENGTQKPLSKDEFNTIVLTYNDTTKTSKVYINGVLQWTSTTGNGNYDKNLSLKFGGSSYWGEMNGFYKDIWIYNRELSEQEVRNY